MTVWCMYENHDDAQCISHKIHMCTWSLLEFLFFSLSVSPNFLWLSIMTTTISAWQIYYCMLWYMIFSDVSFWQADSLAWPLDNRTHLKETLLNVIYHNLQWLHHVMTTYWMSYTITYNDYIMSWHTHWMSYTITYNDYIKMSWHTHWMSYTITYNDYIKMSWHTHWMSYTITYNDYIMSWHTHWMSYTITYSDYIMSWHTHWMSYTITYNDYIMSWPLTAVLKIFKKIVYKWVYQLWVYLGLPWEDYQQAVMDEFLHMQAGSLLWDKCMSMAWHSYYWGRWGSRLVCFCPDHGYTPSKSYWSGSFWSFFGHFASSDFKVWLRSWMDVLKWVSMVQGQQDDPIIHLLAW